MLKTQHQLTKHVKFFQKAVLIHQDRFLILKRSEISKTRALQWDLPGGNSEWPETDKQLRDIYKDDIVREVQEETGITINSDIISLQDMCYFGTFFDPKQNDGEGLYSIIAGWKINLPDNFNTELIQISHEHVEYAWITPERFIEYDFGFAGGGEGFIKQMVFNSFARF